MLGECKYSPGVDTAWKVGSVRFSAVYNAHVKDPDPGVNRDLCKVARSQVRDHIRIVSSTEGLRVSSSNQDQSICS